MNLYSFFAINKLHLNDIKMYTAKVKRNGYNKVL